MYHFRRGREISGFEKLLLSGIPADQLLLGGESEVQLSDLAGNASARPPLSRPKGLTLTLTALTLSDIAGNASTLHTALFCRPMARSHTFPNPFLDLLRDAVKPHLKTLTPVTHR